MCGPKLAEVRYLHGMVIPTTKLCSCLWYPNMWLSSLSLGIIARSLHFMYFKERESTIAFFFLLKDDMEQPLSCLLMIFRNHSVWTCSHLGGYAPCHNLQFPQAEKRGGKHTLVDFCLFMPQITLVTLCLVLICHKKQGFWKYLDM